MERIAQDAELLSLLNRAQPVSLATCPHRHHITNEKDDPMGRIQIQVILSLLDNPFLSPRTPKSDI